MLLKSFSLSFQMKAWHLLSPDLPFYSRNLDQRLLRASFGSLGTDPLAGHDFLHTSMGRSRGDDYTACAACGTYDWRNPEGRKDRGGILALVLLQREKLESELRLSRATRAILLRLDFLLFKMLKTKLLPNRDFFNKTYFSSPSHLPLQSKKLTPKPILCIRLQKHHRKLQLCK